MRRCKLRCGFFTTLLNNPFHFFFDGSFLKSYELFVNRLLYLLLIAATPICIWSACRFFISGWEPLYALHLAFIPIMAVTYFSGFSFAIKATVVVMIFNAVALGNLLTYHMWGLGSGGILIATTFCWLFFGVRRAMLNMITATSVGLSYFFWFLELPLQLEVVITFADVIVQFAALSLFTYPIVAALNHVKLQQAEAEAKQQEQYEKMKQAEASKTAFLANMSHEIRTPLNATLGAIQLLERSELTEQQLKYINISKTSGKWLRHVIDDVLDIERMRAGALEIEPAWFNSANLLEEVAIVFEHNAKEAGLQLDVNIDPDVARWLYGDAGKVHQILYNLVGNALKFTEQGTITATLEKLGQGSTYRFTVTDTGIGIPKEKSDDLFEAFTQIDSSLGRKHQGSGLGLAICRHLAQAMGGEIDYQSSKGAGTSFWFDLDFDSRDSIESPSGGAAPDATARFNESIPDKAYRVLLAEDSEANSYILQAYLEIAGHTVDRASNGVEALKLAETTPYDAILMDISMPEMDGLEATRRLRSSAGENQNTLIIALTAHVQKEIREECTEAGMNDFLAKPVSRDQLLETLDRLIATG